MDLQGIMIEGPTTLLQSHTACIQSPLFTILSEAKSTHKFLLTFLHKPLLNITCTQTT